MNRTDLAHATPGGGYLLQHIGRYSCQNQRVCTLQHQIPMALQRLLLAFSYHLICSLLEHLQQIRCSLCASRCRVSLCQGRTHGTEGPPRAPQPKKPHKCTCISLHIPKADTRIKQTSTQAKVIGGRLHPPPITVHTIS